MAIVEPDSGRAKTLKEEFDTPITRDVSPLIEAGEIDAAILAAPTTLREQQQEEDFALADD